MTCLPRGAFTIAKWFYETYSPENQNISMVVFREPEPVNPKAKLEKIEEEYKALGTKMNVLWLSGRRTAYPAKEAGF